MALGKTSSLSLGMGFQWLPGAPRNRLCQSKPIVWDFHILYLRATVLCCPVLSIPQLHTARALSLSRRPALLILGATLAKGEASA